MYAIVNIQGFQFKVEEGQELFVNRIAEDEGTEIDFNEVLLIDDASGTVSIGQPFVEGASVKAKVLDHIKGDKVIVFKKKRRKGYRVKKGHRQYLSKIQIESITA